MNANVIQLVLLLVRTKEFLDLFLRFHDQPFFLSNLLIWCRNGKVAGNGLGFAMGMGFVFGVAYKWNCFPIAKESTEMVHCDYYTNGTACQSQWDLRDGRL